MTVRRHSEEEDRQADGKQRQEFEEPILPYDDGRRLIAFAKLFGDLQRIGIDFAGRTLAAGFFGATCADFGNLLANIVQVKLLGLVDVVHGNSSGRYRNWPSRYQLKNAYTTCLYSNVLRLIQVYYDTGAKYLLP